LWTPPIEYASTSDTYDYQLGVAGYEDDPGLMQGSRLFYIVPANSSPSSSSSSATLTPKLSPSSTTPSPTPTPTQSSTSTNASPTAVPMHSPTFLEITPTQFTVPPVVIHKGVSTGAAAGIGVGVAIAVLIGPLMVISWFLWKRKAEKRGHARPWKPELQGESRVVSELDSDEKQES
jgi:hypothetical protein